MAETSGNNKKIAKNTVILYIRMILSLCISLYTSRAVLDALGVEDYGIYNIVGGFVSILSIITSSLVMGAQRFITFELGRNDFNRLHKTFSTFVSLFLFLSAALFIVAAIFGKPLIENFLVIPEQRLQSALFVFYCSLAAFCINLISIPYNACVLAHEKMDFYAVVSIGESIMRLAVVLSLVYSPFDKLNTYAALLVLVGTISRIIYGIYCSRNFKETRDSLHLDKSILKEILSFSLWMALGGIVVVAKEQGVNVVINLFCGVTINAARGISMQVSGMLNQFASSLASAINPQITKSYAEGNFDRSVYLTFLLTKAQGILLLLLVVPLYFEMDFILGLWLKEVPYYTSIFAKWVLITTYLTTIRNTYGTLYLAIGDVKTLQWTTSLLYILILPLSYLALKIGMEPVSTMQITAIVEIITFVASYAYMSYKFSFPFLKYLKTVILPLIAICGVCSGVIYLLKSNIQCNAIIEFFIIGFVSVVITVASSYLFLLTDKEKQGVATIVNRKLKRR